MFVRSALYGRRVTRIAKRRERNSLNILRRFIASYTMIADCAPEQSLLSTIALFALVTG